jgi:hypothetical protein
MRSAPGHNSTVLDSNFATYANPQFSISSANLSVPMKPSISSNTVPEGIARVSRKTVPDVIFEAFQKCVLDGVCANPMELIARGSCSKRFETYREVFAADASSGKRIGSSDAAFLEVIGRPSGTRFFECAKPRPRRCSCQFPQTRIARDSRTSLSAPSLQGSRISANRARSFSATTSPRISGSSLACARALTTRSGAYPASNRLFRRVLRR